MINKRPENPKSSREKLRESRVQKLFKVYEVMHPRVVYMWQNYLLDLKKKRYEEARIQRELVFKTLCDFFVKAAQNGLIFYPEINKKLADNFSEDLLFWFVQSLKTAHKRVFERYQKNNRVDEIAKQEVDDLYAYIKKNAMLQIPRNIQHLVDGLFAVKINLN